MLSRSGISKIAAVAAFGTAVAGCSDMYFDRRDTVSLGAGDAIAANKVTQMVDPWPRWSTNNNIAFNGQRMQAAQDRYNRGKAIIPVIPTEASKDYHSLASSVAGAQQQSISTSVAPAAPVQGPNGSNGP
jgi:hypothetical protein